MSAPRSGRALASKGVRKTPTQAQRKRRTDRELARAKLVIRQREDDVCARCGQQVGVDPHHRRNRGMGGASNDPAAHDVSRLVWLCRPCHDWVGANPEEATWEGYLIPHNRFRCSEVPLLYRGVWVFLLDDGTKPPVVVDIPIKEGLL